MVGVAGEKGPESAPGQGCGRHPIPKAGSGRMKRSGLSRIGLHANSMNGKTVLCACILLIAVLICGCTTTTSQQNTAAPAAVTPDLIGNWTGTMAGYEYGTGYTDYSGYTITMSVTEQHDRIFSGAIFFTNETGSPVWETAPCAGVIGRDGRTLTLIEDGGGSSSGTLIAPGEMELIYSDGSDPFSIAINALKRN